MALALDWPDFVVGEWDGYDGFLLANGSIETDLITRTLPHSNDPQNAAKRNWACLCVSMWYIWYMMVHVCVFIFYDGTWWYMVQHIPVYNPKKARALYVQLSNCAIFGAMKNAKRIHTPTKTHRWPKPWAGNPTGTARCEGCSEHCFTGECLMKDIVYQFMIKLVNNDYG